MINATLPEHAVSINTPNPVSNDPPKTNEGTLVLRVGLNGSYSSEFLANQSEVQERLSELLDHLRPLLVYALENRR